MGNNRQTDQIDINIYAHNVCTVLIRIMAIVPKRINCKNIRFLRQIANNRLVEDAIMKRDMVSFKAHTNEKEVERVLKETDSRLEDILSECLRVPMMTKILAGRISKNATRQGSKDELTQIETCDSISSKLGIRIKNLTSTAYRPTKTGEIMSKADMKTKGVRKDECLKSFDAQITGKVNGWVFAKVVYGAGGHQDNVFEEADTLCDWVNRFRKYTGELYVILIDTDMESKNRTLKEKYTGVSNLLIVNHYEFQEYLIREYSE